LYQPSFAGLQAKQLGLRQHGTYRSSVCGFSALRVEKPHTIEIKERSAEGTKA
jgi:hypothetical protein